MFKRCGTPGYVAPEILRYRDGDAFYDEKCDMFSVGVIFFILLTGHKLFKGEDQKQIIQLNRDCQIDYEGFKELKGVSERGMDLLK